VRFNSELGGGAMMDLGCYAISALRNIAGEEMACTGATPHVWDNDPEIDLGMSCDFVFPSGATGHFDCSFVSGDKAAPVTLTATGSRGTMTVEGYNGGGNRANKITLAFTDGETREEVCDGPLPNPRSTMYYQLRAFEAEVRACEARPAGERAMPWTYAMKSCPADAVANMATVDAVYRAAGMAPRRTTAPPPGWSARLGAAAL
jgi:predicted dehydrogenase